MRLGGCASYTEESSAPAGELKSFRWDSGEFIVLLAYEESMMKIVVK
jgi:hypothetical protein